MRHFTCISLLALSTCLFGQKPTEFAVTFTNDTILLQAPYEYHFQAVSYVDAAGKKRKLGPGKIKEVYLGSTHYLSLPTFGGGRNILQRLVMMNERYLLASYCGSEDCKFNIYDRRTNEHMVKMITHSSYLKHDIRSFDKYLTPYFGDCPEILQIIKRGISREEYNKLTTERDQMLGKVSNFDCVKLREADE
jgi:hypothetical protein